jgi:predicted component of type VI protein secretion system
MKNEIKDVLMRALETELKSEYVRTYLVDTLVDNLLNLEEKAPQVQAEELKKLVDLGIISLNDARSVVGILPVQSDELEKRITAVEERINHLATAEGIPVQ